MRTQSASLLVLVLLVGAGIASRAQTSAPTTTPVQIDGAEPPTMADGSAVRPNWFAFYNLYQAPLVPAVPATATTPAQPATVGAWTKIAGFLLPGQTVIASSKGGPCFSIGVSMYYALDAPVFWFPLESPVAIASSPAGGLPCKAPILGTNTYTVTLNVVPW